MTRSKDLFVGGNLGNIGGPNADGVLIGQLTPTDPDVAVLLKCKALRGHCISDDGGLYVNESTPWAEGTADDVEIIPAAPVAEDACYWGSDDAKFITISMDITTAAVALVADIVWEYWNGTAWVAVTGLTDNTTGLTAATGIRTVVFDANANWAKCLVDGVNSFWVRVRVAAFTSITTAPQVGSGHLVMDTFAWIDELTDFTDAGTDDVDALPIVPTVGDALVIVHSEKFCKLKVVTGQARTGTATIIPKYWNGAWTAIPAATLDDDSVGYSATAGTHYIHFVPPSDWVANTAANGQNGKVGFTVIMELTALTDVTQQPLITQGWVLPMKTGSDGMAVSVAGTITKISMNASTKSATNADSTLILVNSTVGTSQSFVMAKGDPTQSFTISLVVAINDKLTLVQITEDGTTEFADAMFSVQVP